MSVHYRKDGLTEAVFEFMPEGATIDADTFERIRETLEDAFNGKKDSFNEVAFSVKFNAGQPSETTLESRSRSPVRFRQWNEKNTQLFQVADEAGVLNVLPPYTHYVDYLPLMERVHRALVDEGKPKGTKSLGQRYINRILLPSGARPDEYFTVYPSSAAVRGLGTVPVFLQIQTEQLTVAGNGQVMLTLAYQGLDAGSQPTYLLDLYARSLENPPIPFAWPEVKAWHDFAHEAVTRAFEFAITDRCRELLGREQV